MVVAPTPVAALNRAVAVAETNGPEAALALVEALGLDGYHVYHAVRAALLRRAGRTAEAAAAYDQAAARTGNAAEQAYLRRARDALRGLE
jgi:RNA polymerase sigma-70 factor (ECF subfamily)